MWKGTRKEKGLVVEGEKTKTARIKFKTREGRS